MSGFDFAYQLTLLVGGVVVLAYLAVRARFFLAVGIPEWIHKRRQRRAFLKLRELDEQMCVSTSYQNCCDSH